MKNIFLLFVFLLAFSTLFAQKSKEDTLKFIEYKNPFWDEIQKSSEEFLKKDEPKKLTLKMDFSNKIIPKTIDEFTKVWYNEPVSQAWTNTCWSFCTTSMFESEFYRLYNKKVKLSEMWTSYWEYLEKAKRFIKERGNSLFGEGSQSNAVNRIWKKYGVVPYEVYTGLLPGQKYLDQHKMFEEMSNYLEFVKKNDFWNEEVVLQTLKDIMNHYMQAPPEKFTYEGKEYTPKSFLSDYLKLNMDDYVDVISILEPGYWKQVSYDVPDNWWHDSSYYNLPLDEFMNAIKNAIKNGYSVALGGDVSEPGYYSYENVAMIPDWDIPSNYINDKARQFRFSNGTTGDDHGIHLVGFTIKDGKWWFLIKDSGSGSRNGKAKGYYFYHEDYVKLKMMVFQVHKSAIEDIIKKFKK
ncbi:MAG: C1 family peptidase [Candidatus Kapaibacteriota bacterium]